MKKQMALPLLKKEQLVTVWCRLGEASRQALTKRFANLVAATAQAELGSEKKEGSDEQDER